MHVESCAKKDPTAFMITGREGLFTQSRSIPETFLQATDPIVSLTQAVKKLLWYSAVVFLRES